MHICACNTLLTDKLWTLVSFVSCIELLFDCLLFQIQMKKKKNKIKMQNEMVCSMLSTLQPYELKLMYLQPKNEAFQAFDII